MNRMTRQLKAKKIYKDAGVEFDWALPQNWLDEVSEFNPDWPYERIMNQFVWQYPVGSSFGKPGPLTEEAEAFLNTLPEFYR